MVIRESSNLDETSQDSELSDWQVDNMDYAKRMVKSSNRVDERLINLYRLKIADHLGIHIGLKNPELILRRRAPQNRQAGEPRLKSILTQIIDKKTDVFTSKAFKDYQHRRQSISLSSNSEAVPQIKKSDTFAMKSMKSRSAPNDKGSYYLGEIEEEFPSQDLSSLKNSSFRSETEANRQLQSRTLTTQRRDGQHLKQATRMATRNHDVKEPESKFKGYNYRPQGEEAYIGQVHLNFGAQQNAEMNQNSQRSLIKGNDESYVNAMFEQNLKYLDDAAPDKEAVKQKSPASPGAKKIKTFEEEIDELIKEDN